MLNERARNFFDAGLNDVAREIRQVLEFIEKEDFFAAKVHWWRMVAKQKFRADMKGDELDLAKSPMDPLFARFQEIHHYNPCGDPILGTMEMHIAGAASTQADGDCLVVKRPPEDEHHPHFLVFSATQDKVPNVPLEFRLLEKLTTFLL